MKAATSAHSMADLIPFLVYSIFPLNPTFFSSLVFISDDFGKTFKRINAEIFNTRIRKDSGIMKSPVNPKKVCCMDIDYCDNIPHVIKI